jgi:hypothetical protein
MRRPTVSLKLEAGVAPIRPTADSGYLNDEARRLVRRLQKPKVDVAATRE